MLRRPWHLYFVASLALLTAKVFVFTLKPTQLIKWFSSVSAKQRAQNRRSSVDWVRYVSACSRRLPGMSCLVQAVAAAFLLRLNGQSTDLVLGVQSKNFQAHAWLKKDGKVILGERDDLNRYAILYSSETTHSAKEGAPDDAEALSSYSKPKDPSNKSAPIQEELL